MTADTLRITEIFHSLQGESRTSGLPTVFVRLTGCPLRCSWCDTEYSFHGGTRMSLDEIVGKVEGYGAKYVCVTGGEPLGQPNCLPLLERLVETGFEVSLETSGALDVSLVDERVVKVLDLKPPASGESHRNLYQNIEHLTANDQVKFVIANREDYDWSVSKILQYNLLSRVSDVLFSPVNDQLGPDQLADWIISDKLPVRFQLQLHRVIWGDKTGV
ncbi:7-carboxy-7-deazaguanine synthase QueE [Endozoicomonas sp. SESOKO2]|uniref:7-carboxy-7-deazaguanine synthase QueE n=1 Tax=Endozoicomonas sp. SESOKO2 TaxID=2828743 RepID=UPI0021480347|nr:7-carboxy-7-deazaguanine synthase QueE [Endozoicomonas sp. SESOKO2]